MSATSEPDVQRGDTDELAQFGYKQELDRSLGSFSSFAAGFSYISILTGVFQLFGFAFLLAGPAFFWSWPIVIVGQFIVALVFAELASHFPVAGSIYQWSKRLSNRTLGWFTGWFYFWAGVVTVTAVAGTVPLVMSSIFGFDLAAKSPIGIVNNLVFWAIVTLVVTTVINAFGVRLLAVINNIGVAAEILHAVRSEWARTIGDALLRRSALGLAPCQGLDCVDVVGQLMGRLLGWDAERTKNEVAAYSREVEPMRRFSLA